MTLIRNNQDTPVGVCFEKVLSSIPFKTKQEQEEPTVPLLACVKLNSID
jgi:hypothetical protein